MVRGAPCTLVRPLIVIVMRTTERGGQLHGCGPVSDGRRQIRRWTPMKDTGRARWRMIRGAAYETEFGNQRKGWLAAKHTTGKAGMRDREVRLGTTIGAHVALPLCTDEVAQVPVRSALPAVAQRRL